MLLLSLFGAAVGYLLLGHSNSLLLLALFRIPLGSYVTLLNRFATRYPLSYLHILYVTK